MTASTTRADLPALLRRSAEVCKDAIAAHLVEGHPDLRFQRQAVFTLAALESSAARSRLEDADIRVVRAAASDGAAVCRTQLPGEPVRTAAACLDAVVAACDGVLGVAPADPSGQWERYLFADADVSVSRDGRRWRVRGGAAESVSTFLDIALGDVVQLTNHRIGELTVQILAWHATEESLGD